MITENGFRILTLYQLNRAIKYKESVIVPKSPIWSKPKPASFMIHLQGQTLVELFDLGMYIYEKGK